MQPILTEIGGISIYAFGFFMAASYLLGMAWTIREAGRKDLDSSLVLEFGFYVLLGGLIGARLFFLLLNPESIPGGLQGLIRFWDGGLVFIGGALSGVLILIFFLKIKKQDILVWLDSAAPGIALGLVLGWAGCFVAGCAFGSPTNVPWAVTFTHPDSMAPLYVQVHPTQIYYSLAALTVFILLTAIKNMLTAKGSLAGLFIILYAFFNFGIDFFRADHQALLGYLSFSQLVFVMLAPAGLALMLGRSKS